MLRVFSVLLASILIFCSLVDARSLPNTRPTRPKAAASLPNYAEAAHDVGKISLAISNYATFGDGVLLDTIDAFTGQHVPSCRFPKTGPAEYLFAGALWIGAVVGTDTLVSVGHDGWQYGKELYPDPAPGGALIYRSISDPLAPHDSAVSDEDFVAVYRDTFTAELYQVDDVIDNRPHKPLAVEVTEKSYAWVDTVAEDFVIFDYRIKNIGAQTLTNVYVGLLVDGDVWLSPDYAGVEDDITGFRKVPVRVAECDVSDDSLPMAWIADNDGELAAVTPVPHATAAVLLHAPASATTISYNWWLPSTDVSMDFGPSKVTNQRNFGTGGTGAPEGDRNKYFLMRNGEKDYDQAYAGYIASHDPSWVTPSLPGLANYITPGIDTRYLMSVGPFDLAPGASAPVVFAFVAGSGLHHVAGNLSNLPANPAAYYSNLDFADLDKNAVSAYRLYDNPGVDTDNDGFKGPYVVCDEDTIYMSGDGIPDFKPYLEIDSCCVGVRGNVNASLDNLVDLTDLSLLVLYLLLPGTHLPCEGEANVNGSGIIDLLDLSLLVAYLTIPVNRPALPPCQ